MGRRSAGIRSAAIVMFSTLALGGVLAQSASAEGACGLITPAAVAKTLHLTSAAEQTLLSPPPPAWSVQSECAVFAWSGGEPAGAAQAEAKLADGTYAVLHISTWAPAAGLLTKEEQRRAFRKTLAAIRRETRAQLVGALHGDTFLAPPHGAKALGFRATQGSWREARAIWWSASSLRIIVIGLRESRKKAAVPRLEKIAAAVVPAFGL
jgi:hypothetical protein